MQGSSIWGFVIVVIGLAYLIIYLTNKPIKSKPGQKENPDLLWMKKGYTWIEKEK